MESAEKSPGLKIAVAAFITISVILAVAAYFLFSAYSSAEARLADVLVQNKQLHESQSRLQTHYNELKKQLDKLSGARPK
jgi:hypothetical protein